MLHQFQKILLPVVLIKRENVVSGQSSKGGVDRSFPDLMSQTDLHGIIKVFVNIHAM